MKANFCLRDSVVILCIIYFPLLKFVKNKWKGIDGHESKQGKRNCKIWEARNSQNSQLVGRNAGTLRPGRSSKRLRKMPQYLKHHKLMCEGKDRVRWTKSGWESVKTSETKQNVTRARTAVVKV